MGFEELSLSGLADDAVELYHAVADDAGLRLVAHIEPDCRLTADRDLLFQALANLLDNAIKYTPRGGTVHVTVNRVAAPPGQPTRAFDLTVSDTGPGIPEELHARVLDPFYRVDASRSAPGNGLGLALVKAVADHHKAELRLRNLAPGLAVTLRLPAQGTPAAGSGQGAAAPKA